MPVVEWFQSLEHSRGRIDHSRRRYLVLPAVGWLVWFFLIPLVIMAAYSFFSRGPYGGMVAELNFGNYSRASEWIYLRILWNSVQLAVLTTLSCLLLGYPMAYVLATVPARMRSTLLVLIIVPFWTNMVLRAYAIKFLLSREGPLNSILLAAGIFLEPVSFSNSYWSVWFGMVTNYLPFMVLPLYVTLEKFDFSLLEAARDLGASGIQSVTKVLLPMTSPGIWTGCILVLIPALGEFVIPDLLGGAKTMLIGNLISEQFQKARDWPFGSALCMLLIGPVVAVVLLEKHFKSNRGRA